eukprot:gene24402-30172_t
MFARNLCKKAFPTVAKQSVRRMGGHHAPPPTDGIEGAIRKVLPHDEQVVMAIMGFYVSLYFVSKALSGGKKAPVEAVASAVSVNAGDVPSIESPEFDAWISTPGNLEKLLQ